MCAGLPGSMHSAELRLPGLRWWFELLRSAGQLGFNSIQLRQQGLHLTIILIERPPGPLQGKPGGLPWGTPDPPQGLKEVPLFKRNAQKVGGSLQNTLVLIMTLADLKVLVPARWHASRNTQESTAYIESEPL